ncbi:phage baseplate protein [uncultured Bilophila sp.]|uniref:phage baseplate protein n=1 Tax=uncultured Bilophila sp. TaxID=529385 RepID=UPI0034A06737
MADPATPSTVQSGEPAAIVRKGVAIAGIQVSVKKSEAHTYTSQATELAMESGATVTDHVILKPVTLAVTVAMTNAGDGADAARDAFESFVEMRKKREPVEVITEHAIYTNMVITNLTPTHSAPYKGALEIGITFQQVSFVELQSVGRSPSTLKGSAKKIGSAPVQSGRVEAKEADKGIITQTYDAWRK